MLRTLKMVGALSFHANDRRTYCKFFNFQGPSIRLAEAVIHIYVFQPKMMHENGNRFAICNLHMAFLCQPEKEKRRQEEFKQRLSQEAQIDYDASFAKIPKVSFPMFDNHNVRRNLSRKGGDAKVESMRHLILGKTQLR